MANATSPHFSCPTAVPSPGASPPEWRCLECNKLLGIRRGAKLAVRVHGHDYLVSLPIEAVCRGCGARNHT